MTGSRRALALAALVGAASADSAVGQRSVRTVRGAVTGIVTDSVTGQPVPYALVTLSEEGSRVFAGESGRFRLTDVEPGAYLVGIAQIGYAPVALRVRFTSDSTPGVAPELVVRLSRRALVLPELLVTASPGCRQGIRGDAPDLPSVVTAVLENAERILALERHYPFSSTFVVQTEDFDTLGRRRDGGTVPVTMSTLTMTGYRKGRVLEGGGRAINYFTTSDLARPAFRRAHCFWPAGVDTVGELSTVRIGFAPVLDVESADWEGILRANATTGALMSSEARLTNLDTTRTRLRTVSCVVLYGEVVPTLLHEGRAECTKTEARTRWSMTSISWRVVQIAFLRRTPGEP